MEQQQQQQQQQQQHYFPLLPTEVFLKIFSYLGPKDVFGNILLTCKRFKNVVTDNSQFIWSHVRIAREMCLTDACQWIQTSSASLRGLTIDSRNNDEETSVMSVTSLMNCPRLRRLDCATVSECVLRCVGKRGKQLRKLVLYDSLFLYENADMANLGNLTSFICPSLFDDKKLAALADHCRQLREIYVDCSDAHDLGLGAGSRGTVTDGGLSYCLERVCGTIRHLRLSNYRYTEESFGWIERCKGLQKLEMR